jgi:hypothetical protein
VNSNSSEASPSIITLCILTVEPSFWCIYLFTTTFLFLLKNKLEGGNSSTEMGARSSMNITSAFGFPLVNFNDVMNWMGLPILVNDNFQAASIVDSYGVNSGPSSPFFVNVSVWSLA